MIFTGEPITAEVAERWGLVNEVVPAASLTERVRALAERVAANAPLAVQTAKPLVAGPAAVTLESLASAVNAFSDHGKEGLAAFREKRPRNSNLSKGASSDAFGLAFRPGLQRAFTDECRTQTYEDGSARPPRAPRSTCTRAVSAPFRPPSANAL